MGSEGRSIYAGLGVEILGAAIGLILGLFVPAMPVALSVTIVVMFGLAGLRLFWVGTRGVALASPGTGLWLPSPVLRASRPIRSWVAMGLLVLASIAIPAATITGIVVLVVVYGPDNTGPACYLDRDSSGDIEIDIPGKGTIKFPVGIDLRKVEYRPAGEDVIAGPYPYETLDDC